MTPQEFSDLRARFNFACGYCQTRETDVGSHLTVDHFEPQSRGGADDVTNWVYCCFAFNSFKGAFWGNGDTALLRPLRDEWNQHLREVNGVLQEATTRGQNHIERLHLNRTPLVEQRREKAAIDELQTRLQNAVKRYEAAEAHIHHIEQEIKSLQES